MLNYNFDTVTEPTSKYMDVGIHENIKLTNTRYEVSPNGNKFIAFDFEDSEGSKVVHTEYEPKPFNEMQTQEDVQIKANIQARRLKQIMVVFAPVEEASLSGNSFEELAKKYVVVLNKYKDTTLARIKVVFNNTDYTTLPRSSKDIFIEPMSVSKENSKIKVLSSDKMERTSADKETTVFNKFDSPGF